MGEGITTPGFRLQAAELAQLLQETWRTVYGKV